MNEINFVWCFVLCALALLIESLRSVRAMRKQAEKSQAIYEKPGQESKQELFHGRLEQAAPWAELLAPINLSESDKPTALDGRASRLDISWNTPWLYLSLALLLLLLLL